MAVLGAMVKSWLTEVSGATAPPCPLAPSMACTRSAPPPGHATAALPGALRASPLTLCVLWCARESTAWERDAWAVPGGQCVIAGQGTGFLTT